MAKRLIQSERVDGPSGHYVRIGFYDDGSLRFRVAKAGPMVITKAYLEGHLSDVIIVVAPSPTPVV